MMLIAAPRRAILTAARVDIFDALLEDRVLDAAICA